MEHGRIFFGVFGPPNEQVLKTVELEVGAFHDLTSGFLAGFFDLNFRASGPNASRVVERGKRFAHLFDVIAHVPTQALLATNCSVSVASGFGDGW